MNKDSQYVVQKLWSYCNVLRDDGLSYVDYVEQLTYLLFLKMAHERSQLPYEHASRVEIETELDWSSLRGLDGQSLVNHYNTILSVLGSRKGILGIIFRDATNKIQSPAHLSRLIFELIDIETWTALDADVKGDAYEGLLQKNAEDTKSGAGQYFTPRSLIQAVVDVMRPTPGIRICDPACGTGGFLLAAHDYITAHYGDQLDQAGRRFLKYDAFWGTEIVASTARLCLMNLFLHGIGGDEDGVPLPVQVKDSLRSVPNEHFDMVLSNPPFGRKSTVTFTHEKGKGGREVNVVVRGDFCARTSNKQLNFLQHIKSLLANCGRAAVVVPDNVLFEDGAGEQVRRALLQECDVHTLLRLPPGIFYANGVKANVLFFDKRSGGDNHQAGPLWVYDLRTGENFTLRNNPLKREHIDDFVACYRPENRCLRQESERFRAFSYEDLFRRDKASLDLSWLRSECQEGVDVLPPPGVIIADIIEDLQAAIASLSTIAER